VAIDLPSPLHRISPEEYGRLVEAGVFDEGARVELIDGLIVDMSPRTAAHENAIAWLNEVLVLALDLDRFQVRVGASLSIASSQPEPDIAVIERAVPRPYHPGTAALVIEVAVSSQRRDLRHKPRIYASAGVPVYWVADLDAGRAVAHSSPRGGAYERVDVVGPDGELDAAHLALPPVSVAELLAAAAG
jgi:Uma2 family endonuclease